MDLAAIKFAGLYNDYVNYGLRDVANCAGIYAKLVRSGEFPARELIVMDMVLRCAIQPQFKLNGNVLAEHLAEIKAKKEHLLAQAMLLGADGKAYLMSNEKFAELLRGLGVDVPMKTSLVTGKRAPALAKKDPEFLELLDHPDVAVQTLIGARLGHKSTLEETRTERLLKIAQCRWPGDSAAIGSAWMPMPLRFSGAHTHRLSGDWSLNVQNLPRKGRLRRAIMAPPGYKVVVVDASQIEARLTAWLCGQQDLVDQFAAGADVYSNFAADIFGKPVNKKDNPNERFIGKTGILGLGFGVGWMKFQITVKVDSKLQTGTEIFLEDAEAMRIVSFYRRKFNKIPASWHALNTIGINTLARGGSWSFGPCAFEQGSVLLPSGLRLFYHDLQSKDGEWLFKYNVKTKKLYGGKLLENLVQALDRVIVFDAGIRIQKRIAPYRLAQQAHDEMAYVVKDEHVELASQIVTEEMVRVPEWAAGLPLAAEVGVGQSYGDAK
jgi:DNA polymerase